MQGAVPPYLDAAMEAFQKNQQAMTGAFGPNMFADLAKRNMAMFEEAAQVMTGKKAAAAAASGDGSAEELAKLKAELAALQAKVDKLGK
jgi:polyhydroxyalkanoate synthesis regulator protein